MFAYCGNNPLCCVDPTGTVSWWGTLLGIAETVGGVFTAPFDGGALFVTGATTTYAAVTESVMVMDASGYAFGAKGGTSIVIDFENGTIEGYGHIGAYLGTDITPSATYSVGIVKNYNAFGDYGGPFVEIGGSVGAWGVYHCETPSLDPNRASSTGVSFSLGSGASVYAGHDYYQPLWQIGSKDQPSNTSNQVNSSTCTSCYGSGGGHWVMMVM